ncbi:MAG: hypothetical protein IJ246_11955 [Clostridia bacterium]|nr:hypothetical protein [Clostridia bacterium]
MLTAKPFVDAYGGYICRQCINSEVPKIHLHPSDVVYIGYGRCPRCHRPDRHLVSGFTFRGKLKLLGKKPRHIQ